jgi:hypothetical protein
MHHPIGGGAVGQSLSEVQAARGGGEDIPLNGQSENVCSAASKYRHGRGHRLACEVLQSRVCEVQADRGVWGRGGGGTEDQHVTREKVRY